jgi:hypothetical protein
MSVVSVVCCQVELITRPEEPYRLWCVVVCDLEHRNNEETMTRVGWQRHKKKCIFVYQVFAGGKERPERAADHSPASSAEVLEK